MSDVTTDYKATVFLPRTDFPMRGDLPVREPALLARWEEMGLWARLRAGAAGRPPFILHDGPPYANGNLHIGHALNKIHKDVINRAQAMAGRDANYIPGWDCHGLPIEWKIEEAYRKAGKNKDEVPILEFRRECREYAQHWLAVQAAEFKRLGVAGDWAQRYATMDFASEAAIAAEIGKFLLNGALYRGLRPVMWSPVEKTALAEAEVEYQDKKDTAIYVRFPVKGTIHANGTDHESEIETDFDMLGSSIVIWTTMPWTIPGNRAIAVSRDICYALIRVEAVTDASLARIGEKLFVAENLLENFTAKVGISKYSLLKTYMGGDFDGSKQSVTTWHPLRARHKGYQDLGHIRILNGSNFVTSESGTGFVHMSPGHGEDDFLLCREHGIEVPDTVQADGTYYPSVPLFAGIHVYKATEPVCAELLAAGALLHREEFMHSYPHSWRSKAPLIYRATPNWFIRMDGPEQIRDNALREIDETQFVPAIGRNRIRSMVASRPDWCISRQRAWGVPIPVFVNKTTHEPLRDPAVMERVKALFTAEGADAWYARPAQDFLGNDYDAADYEQIFDIVDVWFESGSTHAFVLEARGLPTPADLYLEGSDQHRGWFQASLLESVGTRGHAPFKAVVTDGFVLDENGRKMSKSLGNVTAPQEVNDKYGADILRLWVMNADTSEDLRIGPEILKQQAELYRRLRNTLRWLLGSLDGFSESEIVATSAFPPLERFILHRLAELDMLFQGPLKTHDWTGIYPALHHFCATDLSAFYVDIRKDSLYCDASDSPTRRACRTLLDILHRTLTAWLAPALPFTAEDAWSARFGTETSVHETLFAAVPADWRDDALAATWARLREVRGEITTAIETMRREKQIGASLQAIAIVPSADVALLPSLEHWAELCITSAAQAGREAGAALAPGQKCERCWKVLPEVGSQKAHPRLCTRCCDALA